ncbi:MAG: hypothetical protein HC811_09580 [Flammeovirgaceae bacterium]|nr:hypothetical protein [Flammeovirgaceae bacterium]
MLKKISSLAILILTFITTEAQRELALKQVNVPHHYYWREMYVPQLTTGPSSVSWSPDGTHVAYAMAGSIWIQDVNGTASVQLTDSRGYDYQPDWSPDGKTIVFVRYEQDAMQLHLLNIETKSTKQITSGGDVNVDPRFSPDGTRIAYVSTRTTGNFRIWIGSIVNNVLESQPLSSPRKTEIPRYYYGEQDHQLSPSWSPDGKSLVFVTNPDVLHGSGNIYSSRVDHYNPVLCAMKKPTGELLPIGLRMEVVLFIHPTSADNGISFGLLRLLKKDTPFNLVMEILMRHEPGGLPMVRI